MLLQVSVYVAQGNHKCSEVRCLSLHYRTLLTIVKCQSDSGQVEFGIEWMYIMVQMYCSGELFWSVFKDLSNSNNGLVSYYKLWSFLTKKKNWVICDSDFRLGYKNVIQSNRVDGANSSNLGISSVYVGI